MPSLSKLRHCGSEIKLKSADSVDIVEQPGDTYNDPGFGIKELWPGTTPTIEWVIELQTYNIRLLTFCRFYSIVAIHGFDGHREKSWTADNGKLWLRDFLPQALPTARILTYGYDAYTENSPSEQTLHSHAQNFLARLCMSRGTGDTKVHWVKISGICLPCWWLFPVFRSAQ
jgi:hypothetical protein